MTLSLELIGAELIEMLVTPNTIVEKPVAIICFVGMKGGALAFGLALNLV